MNFDGPLSVMAIQDKIDKILEKMKNDIKENNLKEININDYLEEFDFSNNHLDEDKIQYLELCLEREF